MKGEKGGVTFSSWDEVNLVSTKVDKRKKKKKTQGEGEMDGFRIKEEREIDKVLTSK